VAGAGVVHADVRGLLQAGCEQFILLLVEVVLGVGEDAVDLSGGDVDAELAELLEE
jgi:hypothetical protein